MDLEGLRTVLDTTEIPVVYDQFEEKEKVPPLPWIAFYETNSDNFMADDNVFLNVRDITIELYTEKKDIDLESHIEKILNDNGIVFNSYDESIDDQDMYLHSFEVRIWW